MRPSSTGFPARFALAAGLGCSVLAGVFFAFSGGGPAAAAQDRRREITVVARKYAFAPGVIEVEQNDLVRVTLRTDDIAHSLVVDAYRIAKRANPGQAVTFEFRADQPGTFPFYCNLQIDEGCRNMRGELVVHAR